VWGLRNAGPESGLVARRTAWIARAAAPLSGWLPARIVCPSRAAAAAHVEQGYDAARMEIVPNGFDTGRFRPSAERRARARAALGIAPDERLVGRVANVPPVKDHATCGAAAARAARRDPRIRFLVCGAGATPENEALGPAVAATGCAERFLLRGPVPHVEEILP